MNTDMEPRNQVPADVGSENRIAEMRDRRGLKQAELARLLEVSRGQVANIESGTRKVDLPELRRIAGVLDCSVVDLLLPADAPFQPDDWEAEFLSEIRQTEGYDARALLVAVRAVISAANSVRALSAVPKALEGDPGLARAMSDRWRSMDDDGRRQALQLLDTARQFGA